MAHPSHSPLPGRLALASGYTALAALVATATWYFLSINAPSVTYYSDYTLRHNIPVGLQELSASQVRQRSHHYRFITQRGRVREVSYCNAFGTPQPHQLGWQRNRPTTMEFRYDEEGRPSFCTQRNEQGRETAVLRFTPQGVEFMQHIMQGNRPTLVPCAARPELVLSLIGDPYTRPTPIARHVVQRDARGHITRELFSSRENNLPMQNTQRVQGRAFKLDTQGRPVEVRYLNVLSSDTLRAETAPAQNLYGVAGYRLRYSPEGNLSSLTLIDKDGAPIHSEELWSELRLRYDAHGNLVELLCLDEEGQPSLHKGGYARLLARYDARGNQVETSTYGPDGTPCLNCEGYHRLTRQFDTRGRVVESACFDTHGRPCYHLDGYSRLRHHYDALGRLTELAALHPDGSPCYLREGYSRRRMQHDALGRVVRTEYLDAEGKPCLNSEGYSSRTCSYGEYGQVVETTHADTEGKPVWRYGCARERLRYDADGNLVETCYLNAEGELCISHMDHARSTARYNEVGQVVEHTTYDTQGKLCATSNGEAITSKHYEERGHLCIAAHYNEQGELCQLTYGGFAILVEQTDESNRPLELRFLDTEGNPCVNSGGNARHTFRYDKHGNLVEEASYGLDGKLCVNTTDGFARKTTTWDSRNNKVEERYYDADNQPMVPDGEGAAHKTFRWDARGNLLETCSFLVDGSPLPEPRSVSRYDEAGNLLEEAWYGPGGEPVLCKGYHRVTRGYDARGNVVEESFYGPDGRPCVNEQGAATLRHEVDQHDRRVKTSFLDAEGNPCLISGGYAHISWVYDSQNRLTDQHYLGLDGRHSQGPDGMAHLHYDYTEDSDILEKEQRFDANGTLRESTSYQDSQGSRHSRRRYDELGRLQELSYCHADGSLREGPDGFARATASYSPDGLVVTIICHNTDNIPAACDEGHARMVSRYNEQGQIIEQSYADSAGFPCLSKGQFARATYRYDERGRRVEEYLYDTDGQPARLPTHWRVTVDYQGEGQERQVYFYSRNGEARVEQFDASGTLRATRHLRADGSLSKSQKLTEKGRVTEETVYRPDGSRLAMRRFNEQELPVEVHHYGPDGQPVLCQEGYAFLRRRFNANGQQLEEQYFGTDGRPCELEDGTSRLLWVYDARGQALALVALNAKGKLLSKEQELSPQVQKLLNALL